MEIYSAKENKFIVFIYEFMGTAFLVYAINMQFNVINPEVFGIFGIAFMLFATLLIAGPITGAHFNPAVTLGVFISNKHWKDDVQMFFVTIAAEFCGGMFGIMMVWSSLYFPSALDPIGVSRVGVPMSEILILKPNTPYVNSANAFIIEMICTFLFVMINLIVKTRKTSPTLDGFLGCFAVALTLLAMIVNAAIHTGACLNPAVGLAQTSWGMINYGIATDTYYKYLWVYIFAPFTGAIIAGLAHRGHLAAFRCVVDNITEDDMNSSKLIE